MRVGRWLWRSGLVLAVLMCTASTRTAAQTAAAAAARGGGSTLQGERAYASGRYSDALDAFEASYRETGDARTLLRVADAAEKLGRYLRARTALQAYLDQAPDAPDSALVARRIARLDARRGAQPLSAAATQPGDSRELARSQAQPASPAGPVWAWIAGGAAVVVGIVVAGLIVNSESSSTTPAPIEGNVGGTVQTLGGR